MQPKTLPVWRFFHAVAVAVVAVLAVQLPAVAPAIAAIEGKKGETGFVVASDVSLRCGRSVVGHLSRGMIVEVRESKGGWIKVVRRWCGREYAVGWIRKEQAVDMHTATAEFAAVLQDDPNDYGAHLGLAHICYYTSNVTPYRECIELLSKAIAVAPQRAEAYLDRAWYLRCSKRFPEAVADLTKAIAILPGEPKLYCERGECWAENGDHEKAVADFSLAIALAPKMDQFYDDRADAWFALDRPELALADLRTSRALRGSSYIRSFELQVLMRLRRYDEVIGLVSAQPKEDMIECVALAFRGEAYARKGEYAKAMQDFKDAGRSLGCGADEAEISAWLTRLTWFVTTCPDVRLRKGVDVFPLAVLSLRLQLREAGLGPFHGDFDAYNRLFRDEPRLELIPKQWTDWTSLAALGMCRWAEEKYDEAQQWLTAAIERAPADEQRKLRPYLDAAKAGRSTVDAPEWWGGARGDDKPAR